MNSMREQLLEAKHSSYKMQTLKTDQKNHALEVFARLIEENKDFLLKENQKDMESQKGKIDSSLYQRLKLDDTKIIQLIQGLKDMQSLSDPIGQTEWKRELDDGLTLERKTVPLGTLGIIFESRPDVIPQVLSLVLKSGNAAVLKGGKEALNSNRAFMKLVSLMNAEVGFLPKSWAQLIESREDVDEMLKHSDLLDLIIPRGSNELVKKVMNSTSIPVLGHADGICHLYVHPSANLDRTLPLIIDSKIQYPSACNALETLLIDKVIFEKFWDRFLAVAQKSNIQLHVDDLLKQNTDLPLVSDWRIEYGSLDLSVKIVDNLDAAIEHINTYGSHHTDGILAEDQNAIEKFICSVDSASVIANASTRFADGFRYGMGAEVGISTAKTHARGPVGLEGLVIYKYILRGNGQVVASYVGENARVFTHKAID